MMARLVGMWVGLACLSGCLKENAHDAASEAYGSGASCAHQSLPDLSAFHDVVDQVLEALSMSTPFRLALQDHRRSLISYGNNLFQLNSSSATGYQEGMFERQFQVIAEMPATGEAEVTIQGLLTFSQGIHLSATGTPTPEVHQNLQVVVRWKMQPEAERETIIALELGRLVDPMEAVAEKHVSATAFDLIIVDIYMPFVLDLTDDQNIGPLEQLRQSLHTASLDESFPPWRKAIGADTRGDVFVVPPWGEFYRLPGSKLPGEAETERRTNLSFISSYDYGHNGARFDFLSVPDEMPVGLVTGVWYFEDVSRRFQDLNPIFVEFVGANAMIER